MKSKIVFDFARLKLSLILMIIFWVIAVVLWQITGDISYRYNFAYIGTTLGLGIGMYMTLPKQKKPWDAGWHNFWWAPIGWFTGA